MRKEKYTKSTTGSTFQRTLFTLSREIEFFTERELESQIGQPKRLWRVALAKELIDNALDACETASLQPVITITDAEEYLEVTDNGPGIPTKTIAASLNYLLRASDKLFWVSPTRGQLGNALKCAYAAAYVLFGKGVVEIEALGVKHTITTSLDRIAQKPVITREETKSLVRKGTSVRLMMKKFSGTETEEDDPFLQVGDRMFLSKDITLEDIVDGYAALNPHATFQVGERTCKATDPAWSKWRTDSPTSAHWYDSTRLRDLIAAFVTQERSQKLHNTRTVRELVSKFRGLSSTVKQKAVTEGFKAVHLTDLVKDGDIDSDVVAGLLARIQEASRPVKPLDLGLIGEAHLKGWIEAHGGNMKTFRYSKSVEKADETGLPHVVEMAFAMKSNEKAGRTLLSGLNWSPMLGTPLSEMSDLISQQKIFSHHPVILVMHAIRPRFEFLDHAKSRIS